MPVSLEEKVRRLEMLTRVGIALSRERDRDRLLEMILVEAQRLCNAEGGTLYLRSGDQLRFEIVRNETLGLAQGGSSPSEVSLPPVVLRNPDGSANLSNVASHVANKKFAINIADAYCCEDSYDFSGTKLFDAAMGYRSTSFLTIPLLGAHEEVLGVLQLINARADNRVIAFGSDEQDLVETLAAQAAITLENRQLIDAQKALFESFIQVIASAIDAKSPHTGSHCERVPLITKTIAEAILEQDVFPSFQLAEDDWYELDIAAWLHDCGKITTPVHIIDKATKLESIVDRIDVIRWRFETARALAANETDRAALDSDFEFLRTINRGTEFLAGPAQERLRQIATRLIPTSQGDEPLLTQNEVANLLISRGTLTDEERLIINGHMAQTVEMLDALPFPPHLRNVPLFATGHHERMDGKGYPRGCLASDLPVQARIIALADVFEALTAHDRPYKKAKMLSETMSIIASMKQGGHLDSDIVDAFIRSGAYRRIAEQILPTDIIDEVDEEKLLSMQPASIPSGARRSPTGPLLPEFEPLRKNAMGTNERG